MGLRLQAQGDDPVVLQRLVAKFFRGIERKDTVTQRKITTADFVLYEEGKVWNNDSGFANIRRNLPFTVRYRLSGFVIHVDEHSGDARWMNHADFVFEDTARESFDWVESGTFRKEGGEWKINFLSVARRRGWVAPRYDTIRFIPEHYNKQVARFRQEPMTTGGTILLGNSLTEYGDWKKLLGDSGVVNRGIAGDNTFGILERLDDVIARRPGELFIETGFNDIAQDIPIGTILTNIVVIMGKVRLACPGVKIYVTSVSLSNGDAKKDYPEVIGKNGVGKELNQALKEEVEDAGGVFIDLRSAVEDGNGELDHRYARADGIHLNSAGYAIWAGLIKKGRSRPGTTYR
jgi:lysophospholipase L1-like esterase